MTPSQRAQRAETLVFVLGPLLTAALSIWLGQSTSWDLRNYHWYNPYSLLNGRLDFDAAVAHHATFYNPLIDLPLWAVGNLAPGWVAGAFLGLVQGLNFSFLYLIGRDALSVEMPARRLIAFGLAVLGVTGGDAVILVGTTYYDNVVSIPVLAGLWLVIKHRNTMAGGDWRAAWRPAVLAGLLVGLAVGLKLPTAPFGLAIIAAIAVAGSGLTRRLSLVFVGGIAAFVGLMITSGWWFVVLWQETGNPLFPYFNDVIGSTLILDSSYRDTRFLPKTWDHALFYPFRFSADWRVSADWAIHDSRIAFAYVAVPLGALLGWTKLGSTTPIIERKAMWILFAFAAASYLSWLGIFAIYRYIAALEMLAPLLIVAAIGLLPLSPLLRWGGIVATLIAVVAMTGFLVGERVPFASRIVEVQAPAIQRPDDTLALMTGVEPMGYVIPSFPPQIAFLRVDGYLVGPGADTAYLRRMTSRIADHLAKGGDLFTMFIDYERDRGDQALSQLGLRRTDECVAVPTNLRKIPFQWCRVVSAGTAEVAP